MTLKELVRVASNKENFTDLKQYAEFCRAWLDFIGRPGNLQAEIVSRNETQYRFLQFKGDGSFNVTRPLNYNLLYGSKQANAAIKQNCSACWRRCANPTLWKIGLWSTAPSTQSSSASEPHWMRSPPGSPTPPAKSTGTFSSGSSD